METQLIDRYEIIKELGHGGMGIVYQARDTLLDREVAIKVLSETSQSRLGTQGRSRLLHEAKSAARLNHPNIVSIYDAGEDQASSYIVMELIRGNSLYEKKPKSIPEIISIARQVCAGLEHAHQNGIIHRDLKPENILVTNDGLVKITDFGLARSIGAQMTYDSLIVGTVYYLAPEVAKLQEYDRRVDLYSLGIILYELTAGCLPFQGEEPLSVISQHLYAPVVPPRACNPSIPHELDALIVSMMAKAPESRPASAIDVSSQISRIHVVTHQDLDQTADVSRQFALDRMIRGRLIGREREFNLIEAAWNRTLDGKGEVILISGEPGIGKTRLAREVTARALVSGGQVLSGACYVETGIPYAPFPQIIQEAVVKEHVCAGLSDLILHDLARLAPGAKELAPYLSKIHSQDPTNEQQRTFESILALITIVASQSPLLIFLDDIHWADKTTLLLIQHLARHCKGHRILILLTYREIELIESGSLQNLLLELAREHLSTRIKLTRFDQTKTKALLGALLSPEGTIHPSFLDAIYMETEGNPFFIEEVCKTLIEDEKLILSDGQWNVQNVGNLVIPQNVRITIQTRLARLQEKTLEVLRTAALIGKEFDTRILQRACNLPEDAIIDALESAEHAQIISELPGKTAGAIYSFAHNLIASTLRENMNSLRRQRMHRSVAQAIQIVKPDDYEALAYQFEQAGDAEQALAYYTRAADRAIEVFANPEAEHWYRAALEITTEQNRRAPLLEHLAEALFRQAKFKDAVQTWGAAADIFHASGDTHGYAHASARRARAAWYHGDSSTSLQICLQALQAIPEYQDTDIPGVVSLIHETARSFRFNNLPDQAYRLCQKALELSRKIGLVEVEAESLATLGILPNQTPEQILEALNHAVELSESARLYTTAIRAHTNLGEYFRYTGDFSQAKKHIDLAGENARRIGGRSWQFELLVSACELNFDLSNFSAIQDSIQSLRDWLPFLADRRYNELRILSVEARLNRFSGNWQEANIQLRKCLELAEENHMSWLLGNYANTLADMLYELNQLDEAEYFLKHYPPVIELNPTIDPIVNACWLSCIYTRSGKLDDARYLLKAAEKMVADQPSLLGQAYLQYCLAQLSLKESDYKDALERLEQLAEQLSAIQAYWYQGRILGDLADAYLNRNLQGDQKMAVERLSHARLIYQKLDLPVYAAKYTAKIEEINRL